MSFCVGFLYSFLYSFAPYFQCYSHFGGFWRMIMPIKFHFSLERSVHFEDNWMFKFILGHLGRVETFEREGGGWTVEKPKYLNMLFSFFWLFPRVWDISGILFLIFLTHPSLCSMRNSFWIVESEDSTPAVLIPFSIVLRLKKNSYTRVDWELIL